MEETLKFNVTGLAVAGAAKDSPDIKTPSPGTIEAKIVLKPGDTKLIELEAVSFPWKISTAVGYLVK